MAFFRALLGLHKTFFQEGCPLQKVSGGSTYSLDFAAIYGFEEYTNERNMESTQI